MGVNDHISRFGTDKNWVSIGVIHVSIQIDATSAAAKISSYGGVKTPKPESQFSSSKYNIASSLSSNPL